MPYVAVTIPYAAITIVFIVLSGLVGAFVRRRSRDKCLRDFEHDPVTLEQTDGKLIWGKLSVENTGLELIYPQKHKDPEGHDEASYIMYKTEYPKIQAILRFPDELDEAGGKTRQKELKKTYHPNFLRRLKRRIMNIFNKWHRQ